MGTRAGPAFGELLWRYRRRAALTQEELAERAGLSDRTIRSLETGERRLARPETLRLLAEALDLSEQERAAFVAARQDASPPVAAIAPTHGLALPLVGRAREIGLLERHLAGEDPPLLLLAGEPGIGKSRLLHEAARLAGRYGQTVLYGGCQRQGGQHPYTPLLEALEGRIRRSPHSTLATELRGCAWLVRLLPELAAAPIEALPSWALTPDQERRLMYGAVTRYLANIAGPTGTLLLLDDLQWIGQDALDLLAALVRAAPEVPLRLVAAYRDTETAIHSAFSMLLADLAHEGVAAHHTLPPLDHEEAGRLVDSALEGAGAAAALREQIVRRTGGVPFFIVSYAQALSSPGSADGDAAVPWSVTHSVRQRVATLPQRTRELLELAAIVGRVAPSDLLAGASARPRGEVVAALDAARRVRLLDEEGADAYRFPHDVIREVIETDLGAGRRAILHGRVAMALEVASRGCNDARLPVEALAYHYSRSDAPEKALVYLETAGDRARAQAALAAAADFYRELAERLHALGRVQDEARAQEKRGFVLNIDGRYEEAAVALERAADLYRATGNLTSQGRVTAEIGYVYANRGMVEEGITYVRAILEPLEEAGAWSGLSALYSALASLLFFSGRYAEHPQVAGRAVELARMIGDDALVANAELARGSGLLMLGRGEEALQSFTTAAELAEAAGDLSCLGMALTNLATISMYGGALAESLAYTERALAVAEQRGDPLHIALMRLKRAIISLFDGNWRQAHDDMDWIVGLSDQLGASWGFAYSWLALGTLQLLEGNWEDGARTLEESISLGARAGDLEIQRWAHSRLAERDILAGRPAEARDRILPLLDRPGLEELDVTVLLPRLAWAYLELGDPARAGTVIEQALARAERQQHRIALADALWVQTMVATRQEQWDAARRAAEAGLALTRQMPYPYAEARLLHAYGLLHARTGEKDAARQTLRQATAIFARLGARKDVELVEQAATGLE